MAPKRTGLGPLGYRALENAARYAQPRPPSIDESPFISASESSEARSSLTVSIPGEAENIPSMLSFNSSRVSEAGYDRSHDRLYVRFMKPAPGAVTYVYDGVPENVWHNFRRSKSAGQFINRVLNQYSYHQLSE